MGQIKGILIGQGVVENGIMVSHAGEYCCIGKYILIGLKKYQIIFLPMMLVYMGVCVVTFSLGSIQAKKEEKLNA